MDQLLCTWRCLSECGCCVDVSHAWHRVYATTKRACYWVMVRTGGLGIGWELDGQGAEEERWASAHGWYHVD